MPSVQKMSLCATGMPRSGARSPAARRRSASRACFSARSGSTVMNAFSSPLRRAMRSRKTCVSSALDIFFASSAEDSSTADSSTGDPFSIVLLDDPRHEVEPLLDGRRRSLVVLAPIRFRDFVLTQSLTGLELRIERMRHRFDPGRIDGLHLVDEPEQVIQLRARISSFGVVHGDAREPGNATDLVEVERHVALRKKGFGAG